MNLRNPPNIGPGAQLTWCVEAIKNLQGRVGSLQSQALTNINLTVPIPLPNDLLQFDGSVWRASRNISVNSVKIAGVDAATLMIVYSIALS